MTAKKKKSPGAGSRRAKIPPGGVAKATAPVPPPAAGAPADPPDRFKEELRRLAAVFVDCHDAVIVRDFDGRITAWNPAAERMYGYTEAEALAMNILQLVPPELLPRTRALAARLRRGERVSSWETRRVRKDGRAVDVWLTVTTLRDEAGRPTAVATTERDVSERNRAREDLERLVEDRTARLEAANRELRAEVDERRRAEARVEELLHSLNERVKELTALHRAARALQDDARDPAELFRAVGALLVNALQFPEAAAARVRWGEVEGATPGYRPSPWGLTAGFTTADHREGAIDAVYLEETPAGAGRPFAPEEGDLIRSLAELVKAALDRHLTRRALRESRDRIAAIVDTAAEGIITIDERGVVDSYNKAAERMFGYPPGEVIGRTIGLLMPRPCGLTHDGHLAGCLEAGLAPFVGHRREAVGRRRDGSVFPMELAVSEFRDGSRRLFTGVVRDVGERKALEKELLEIAAAEQRRIGQDLHDSVGQELTGLGLMAEELVDRLEEHSRAEAGLAGKVSGGLKRTLGQVRALSRGLIPVDVDAGGLMAALSELAARVTGQGGAACTFTCAEPVPVGDNVQATHLYRITQEAVTNALRHGRARHIDVSLRPDGPHILLEVRDDGDGIRDQDPKGRGAGLRTMRHRASLIGASLIITAAGPGGGTVVTCRLARGGRGGED